MKEDQIIKFREKVQNAINEADPWYLLEMGAPKDEYSKYVDQIVSFMVNFKPHTEQLYLKLLKIFETKEFDISKDQKVKFLAEKLVNIYSRSI
jgi:3-methyladenine DNA glycosylase Tag